MSIHNIPFQYKKENQPLNYLKSAAMRLMHKFETAMANEPSVFEPLRFYCI